MSATADAEVCAHCSAGPNYPYDYQTNTWDGSYQQRNTSTYYDAQKHAFMQPGTAGWFQWNWLENSGVPPPPLASCWDARTIAAQDLVWRQNRRCATLGVSDMH